MYRPRSEKQISGNSQDSSNRSQANLDTLNVDAPYDNAKAKSPTQNRIILTLCDSSQTAAVLMQLLLLLVVVILWGLHLHVRYQTAQARHLVVLDAGSTGTRAHIFQYTADTTTTSYATLKLPEQKLKVQPGLSAYADDAAGAAASLQPLLQFAAQHIPAAQMEETPIYLMATAGLRLLPAAAVDDILQQCRSALLSSGLRFEPDWAQVISGVHEGLYGWVAVNYAAGHLQAAAEAAHHSRKDLHTAHHIPFKALLEMGGASAQVTFMPKGQWHKQAAAAGSKQRVHLRLPGLTHPLWVHSFLGYGFDVVQQKVDSVIKQRAIPGKSTATVSAAAAAELHASPASVAGAGAAHDSVPVALPEPLQQSQELSGLSGVGEDSSHAHLQQGVVAEAGPADVLLDPCLPKGYQAADGRVGSGVWQHCQQVVEAVLDPSTCSTAPHTPCPEVPANMPELTGELLAIENFAHTAHALSLPAVSSLGEYAVAARQFCSQPWQQTAAAHAQELDQQEYLWRYCFGSALSWTLLHRVLHISEAQQLTFTNVLRREDGVEMGLDWALGAAVLKLVDTSAAEGAALMRLQHKQQLLLFAALLTTFVLLAWLWLASGPQRAGKQGQATLWQVVAKQTPSLAGVGYSSKAAAAVGSGLWGSMVSSTWANAAGRSSLRSAGYMSAHQQVRL